MQNTIERKIEQSSGFMEKARNFVRGKAVLYALGAALTFGAAGCDSGGEDNRSECCKSYSSCEDRRVDTCTKIFRECYDDSSGSHCITDSYGNKSCCSCDESTSDTCWKP